MASKKIDLTNYSLFDDVEFVSTSAYENLSDEDLISLIKNGMAEYRKRVKKAITEKEEHLQNELTKLFGTPESRGAIMERFIECDGRLSFVVRFNNVVEFITKGERTTINQCDVYLQYEYGKGSISITVHYDSNGWNYSDRFTYISECDINYRTPPVSIDHTYDGEQKLMFETLNDIPLFRILFNDLRTNLKKLNYLVKINNKKRE